MKNRLSAIIPVYNEEKHLPRLLKKLKNKVSEIIIIDSFSNDKTYYIAKKFNCRYFNQNFKNFSEKINFGIKKSKFEWVFEIHADEVPETKFFYKLYKILDNNKFNSVKIIRNLNYMNKILQYGGIFPQTQIRIWKRNYGYYKAQFIDERVTIKKKKLFLSNLEIIDTNLNNNFFMIKKHIGYARKESVYYEKVIKKLLISNKLIKDKITKKKILYYRFPIFIRSVFLFLYRLIIKQGFRDGYEGLIFCLIQTLFYRFIVDFYIFKKKLL